MLPQKRVTISKLISYVQTLSKDNTKINYVVDTKQDNKFYSDHTFKCLNYGTTKMTDDLPHKLRSYFDPFVKEFIRHGSTKTYVTNENISLFFCILKLCVPNFGNYTNAEQMEYIKCLREKLIAYISNTDIFKNNYSKMKWDKKTIVQSLMQFKVTRLTLKLIADYFSINIFILNITEDKLYVVSHNDRYDMFRFNVFVSLNNDTFESLTYGNERMLTFDNVIVKKLISIHKNILILFNVDMGENNGAIPDFVMKLDDLVQPIVNKENEYDEITESDSNAFVKDIENNCEDKSKKSKSKIVVNEEGPTGIVFNVSLKMKLDALQDMATKLNIDINKNGANSKTKTKPKTKNELVDEINKIMLK